MNLKKFSSYAVVLTAMAALLGACSGGTVYDQYDHTPLSGWEKNDTLSFDIPPMKHTALYREELGLRINGAFPFKSLQLIVEQKFLASKRIRRDTLNCRLIDNDGNVKGRGVSFYQYLFHIDDMEIEQGDSLRINIRHNMKREILPGIADVGIKFTRR